MITQSDRRSFFKTGVSSLGALALASPIGKALAASCGMTPSQTSGPFYPGETQFTSESNDLTKLPGHIYQAKGQVVYIRGKVLDSLCRPIPGATVEIWQACASGRYNNPGDTNPAPLDPHFKYWAETLTDINGEYSFKTIIPGAYPADTNWTRPPHIHFKVSRLGFRELVTQMYFKGQVLNDRDLILQALKPSDRESVIVDFQPSSPELDADSLTGNFEITMQSVR